MSIAEERIRFEEDLPGGWSWSHILKRGSALRITDVEGGGNVAALFYNGAFHDERYNMADTLKAQHISYLTAGNVCYSDMGRVLVSITGDTCGWHDAIGGLSHAALIEERYGRKPYQEARNEFHRDGRSMMLTELAKWGLGRRDLLANVNFFSKVAVAEDGEMSFVPGNSAAGSAVDLRAEMNTLVVLVALPHPMDPATSDQPKPIHLTVYTADAPGPDDPCRMSCEQNQRGFINTDRYFL